MRTAFIKTLTRMAENDPNVMLLVGDLGFGVVQEFAERFPKQFLNAGVAEQNMAGVATGLALSGKVVFTYSIANFPIIRCLEQLRNDACYHRANVVSVSVGGGYSYGALGMTHHGTEDISIMRSLPEMTVIAPGDPFEAEAATEAASKGIGPVFLRLGRAEEPKVHEAMPEWKLGKAIVVRSGKDVTLISTGAMLKTTMDAANALAQDNIDARVISMHTVKPIDRETIFQAVRETRALLTVEEHDQIGGLGSAVAEVLFEMHDCSIPCKRIALPSEFCKYIGDQDYLRTMYGLSVENIVQQTRVLIQ